MIYQDGMDKVLGVLMNRAKEYEELAKESTDSESLYGYFKGFEDATEIATSVIQAKHEVNDDKEFEDLCDMVTRFTAFYYDEGSNIESDYLKQFKIGRERGGKAAVAELGLVNIEDFTEKRKDKRECKD